MKYVMIMMLLGLLVLGGIYVKNGGGTIKVDNRSMEVETKEVIKEVNPLDELYEQREKELDEKYSKIQSTQARIDVNQAEIDRLNGLIKEDRSKLADFMTAIE